MNKKFYSDKLNYIDNNTVFACKNDYLSNNTNFDLLQDFIRKYFDTKCVYIKPVISCTSANTLSILSVLNSGEKILCSDIAHLLKYENNEIRKKGFVDIEILKTENGKICLKFLKEKLNSSKIKYSLLSITQPTEVGTVYTLKELENIHKIASDNNIIIHIDGARFFYAVNYLNCFPKKILVYCDLLTLGTRKFGNQLGDLIVMKDCKLFDRQSKLQEKFSQKLHCEELTLIKMKMFFNEETYIFSAKHANKMAVYMNNKLSDIKVKILYSVQSNIIYFSLKEDEIKELLKHYKLAISSRFKNTVRAVISPKISKKDIDKMIRIILLIQTATPGR